MISRRRFLRGLGVSTAASAFVPLLDASGAEPLLPRRLILYYTPHGTVYDNWAPQGTETDFKLSRILTPLEPHKRKVTVISGLALRLGLLEASPHTQSS